MAKMQLLILLLLTNFQNSSKQQLKGMDICPQQSILSGQDQVALDADAE
jgi:hypothetical protein